MATIPASLAPTDGPAPSPASSLSGSGQGQGQGSGGGGVESQGDLRPILIQSVVGPAAATIDPAVLATNLLLTLLVVLLIGLSSSVFNSTIDDNRADIEAWRARFGAAARRRLAPLAAIGAAIPDIELTPRVARTIGVVSVLGLTGLVYSFLSPDFAFDGRSLILFLSLAIGLGIVTYLAEGGSVLLARRYRVESTIRLYATALAIAILSVLVSRLIDFRPGVVYGFVASSVVLAPLMLDRRRSAQLVLLPALALLGVSIVAWLLLPTLGAAARAGDTIPLLLDGIATAVFVAGLEGVFYSMLPLTFLDGSVVYRWNRAAWGLIFGLATFLFWHLIINQYASYLDAFRQTGVVTALAVVLFCVGVSGAVWLFFKLRQQSAGRRETA